MFRFVLWIILVCGLIIGSIAAIKVIVGPNQENIGPHEIANVQEGDYFTLPKVNTTISGYDFFVLTNQKTKQNIYPVFVPPTIGEEYFHFVTTNPPEGKYKVTGASISLYSETPTSIIIQDDPFDRGFKTTLIVILVFAVFIFGSMILMDLV